MQNYSPPIRCSSVPFSCPVIVGMRSGEVKWIENQLAECFCLFFSLPYLRKLFELQRSSANRFTVGHHSRVWSIWRHHQGLLRATTVMRCKIRSYFPLLARHILSPSLSFWAPHLPGGAPASLSSFSDKRNVHVDLTHREPILIK